METSSSGVDAQVMVPRQLISITLVLVVLIVKSFSTQKSSKQDIRIWSWAGPAAIRAMSSANASINSYREAMVKRKRSAGVRP